MVFNEGQCQVDSSQDLVVLVYHTCTVSAVQQDERAESDSYLWL